MCEKSSCKYPHTLVTKVWKNKVQYDNTCHFFIMYDSIEERNKSISKSTKHNIENRLYEIQHSDFFAALVAFDDLKK